MVDLKFFFKAIVVSVVVFLTSCGTKHELTQEKYAIMNIPEKIDYLYLVFPDTNTVSRMTLALPDNIEKIKSGKVKASEKFTQRVDMICQFYIESGFNNPKTLREFDPDFSWYDKVFDMDELYGWYWFWGILLGAVILSAICQNPAPVTIVTVIYGFCAILSFIFFMLSDPIAEEPYPSYVAKTQFRNRAHTIEFQTNVWVADVNIETNNLPQVKKLSVSITL